MSAPEKKTDWRDWVIKSLWAILVLIAMDMRSDLKTLLSKVPLIEQKADRAQKELDDLKALLQVAAMPAKKEEIISFSKLLK